MGQQEYDNFKQHLKDWKEAHPDEYDLFEEEMNRKDATGYQKILGLAIQFVPPYQKLIDKKINQGTFDDISDIENLLTENKLGISLLKEMDNSNDSTVPAMLAWLYFGQSFERMVERGEELRKSPEYSYLQKFMFAATNKILVSQSIKLGFRTKADWEEHRRLMKMVDSSEVLDWEVEEEKKLDIPAVKSKNNKELSLEEMIILDDEKKRMLLTKMGDYIQQGMKGKKIAWMILALRQLGYLPNTTSNRHLFNAIKKTFNVEIGSDKGIYAYIYPSAMKNYQTEIEALMNYFRLN